MIWRPAGLVVITLCFESNPREHATKNKQKQETGFLSGAEPRRQPCFLPWVAEGGAFSPHQDTEAYSRVGVRDAPGATRTQRASDGRPGPAVLVYGGRVRPDS